MKVKRILVVLVIVSFVAGVLPFALAEQNAKVNINTASLEELVSLKGIGPTYAEKIITYRQTHGPFEKAEDITKVKGIGWKTYEVNKGRITVE